MLQWGHAFSDVETENAKALSEIKLKLQWGHAFSDVETMTESLAGDHGIALQWGHAFSDVETKREILPCGRLSFLLQWGHAFSDVETRIFDGVITLHTKASMGPRLFRRGNLRLIPESLKQVVASMGPRLFRRGNRFAFIYV